MPESRATAYKQRMDELMKFATELGPEARKQALDLLAEANREIIRDLGTATPDSYSSSRLQALKDAIDSTMDQFRRTASSRLNSIQSITYRATVNHIDATISAGTGESLIQPVADPRQLLVAQGYTADLITGLSDEARNKIKAAIQRAHLGRTTVADLIATVGSAQEGGRFSGFFGKLGQHAADTASNEVLRVHSVATQSRVSDLATRNDGIGKEWVHLPIAMVPRVSHLLADKQVVAADKPFVVGGEELMYPRDPGGTPANTIFCHCLVRPHLAVAQLKPTDSERDLLRALGISVTTSRR